ncbi:hypothetical protein ACHAXT_004761 [Thalassiosira profunda]
MTRRHVLLAALALAAVCLPAGSAFAPSPRRSSLGASSHNIHAWNRSPTRVAESNEGEIDPSTQEPNLLSKFVTNVRTAASDGFGTRARNVGSTMEVGDVVVPLCGNLDKRQDLAQVGLYAGVEYEICNIEEGRGEEGERLLDERIATLKPAYPLRPHLERSDWPISLPVSEVPLWLPRVTYEAGTAIGTLALAGTYLSIAAILATIVRIVGVPSESMEPALMPGDVVLVTRSLFTKPKANDVVFFNPPSELDEAIANSKIGRAAANEKVNIQSTKGKQFLKRVVGVPGDRVGVSHSNPYVALQCSDDEDCTYRVDRTGAYSRPDVFPDESWNRVTPTITFGSSGTSGDRKQSTLGRECYFVAGDNGYRSVDSRVWGPLKSKYLFGTAQWVLYPLNHFGPIQPGPFVTENGLSGNH